MTESTFHPVVPLTRWLAAAAGVVLAWVAMEGGGPAAAPGNDAPSRLSETGLYDGGDTHRIAAGLIAFTPQFPLWTDGAAKRRWIALPAGGRVDASDPDDWRFPVGTKVWKEFAFDGRPVETRFMQRRRDGSWLYAAYAWRGDGSDADLVGPSGRKRAYPLAGGRFHAIPGVADCRACHEGRASRVLGFSALQLAVDPGLARLLRDGWIEGWDGRPAPRIPGAPVESAAAGFLHGNCGHCHDATGPLANLGLVLWQPVQSGSHEPTMATRTASGVPVRRVGFEQWRRVVPADADRSFLFQRAASRDPLFQMPPLGTVLVDPDALAVLRAWIDHLERPDQRRNTHDDQHP